jgi:hypothetical protein
MKITKTLLILALVGLTSAVFGKISEPEVDCNCCPEEIFMDQDLSLEDWMIEPFESTFENELAMEEWMSEPFEVYFESEFSVESWMVTPFESNANVEVEQWMAAAWF